MKILNTLDTDTNVFVISHKGEILDGRFKDKIEFSKKKNFSTAEINSVQAVMNCDIIYLIIKES